MNRLLYENSVSYQGYLIIPFLFQTVNQEPIYSYVLLSGFGHKSKLHQSENPSGLYSSQIDNIIKIAQEFLDQNSDFTPKIDYFKSRYTYQNNLIIVYQEAGKYFYDHYPPERLTNIAAPKIFQSEQECLTWIQKGLKQSNTH